MFLYTLGTILFLFVRIFRPFFPLSPEGQLLGRNDGHGQAEQGNTNMSETAGEPMIPKEG